MWFVPLLINIIIGVGLQAIGYLLMPQSKSTQPDAVTDMDNPTAEGGRPIPVVFGELEVTGVNIIDFLDKQTITREIDG